MNSSSSRNNRVHEFGSASSLRVIKVDHLKHCLPQGTYVLSSAQYTTLRKRMYMLITTGKSPWLDPLYSYPNVTWPTVEKSIAFFTIAVPLSGPTKRERPFGEWQMALMFPMCMESILRARTISYSAKGLCARSHKVSVLTFSRRLFLSDFQCCFMR